MPKRIVIVGASLAGATAAVTLRKEGFEGAVTLVGAEPHIPYERPPLSKAYLRGEATFDDLVVRHGAFYGERGIDLVLATRVESLDTDRRTVAMEEDRQLPYDHLLLATGTRNRRPAVEGRGLGGVHMLRTVDDCDRLRMELAPGMRVVIGGMSFIGSEVAASLRQLGLEVTVVLSGDFPLAKVLGDELGGVLAAIHRDHGVRLVPGDRVASIEGDERVETVVTAKGERLACDLVVLAMGVEPQTDLAGGTAIEVDDGIVVDERCRTNVEDVFACGDVARFAHPTLGERLRVEHWQHARRHGRAAALSMLGGGRPYEEIPWFWSDQYDHEVQYAGHHAETDEVIIRRGNEGLAVYYVRDLVLRAIVALDLGRTIQEGIAAIADARQIDRAELSRFPTG